MTAEDAAEMADAIDRAVPDLSPTVPWSKFAETVLATLPDGGQVVTYGEPVAKISLFEYFGGGSDYLIAFAQFCRRGSFIID